MNSWFNIYLFYIFCIAMAIQQCSSRKSSIKCWKDIIYSPVNASAMSPKARPIECKAPDNVCTKIIFEGMDGNIAEIQRSCEDKNDQRLDSSTCASKGFLYRPTNPEVSYWVSVCHCNDQDECNASTVNHPNYTLISIMVVLVLSYYFY